MKHMARGPGIPGVRKHSGNPMHRSGISGGFYASADVDLMRAIGRSGEPLCLSHFQFSDTWTFYVFLYFHRHWPSPIMSSVFRLKGFLTLFSVFYTWCTPIAFSVFGFNGLLFSFSTFLDRRAPSSFLFSDTWAFRIFLPIFQIEDDFHAFLCFYPF